MKLKVYITTKLLPTHLSCLYSTIYESNKIVLAINHNIKHVFEAQVYKQNKKIAPWHSSRVSFLLLLGRGGSNLTPAQSIKQKSSSKPKLFLCSLTSPELHDRTDFGLPQTHKYFSIINHFNRERQASIKPDSFVFLPTRTCTFKNN